MIDDYRVYIAYPPGEDGPDRVADQVLALVATLGWVVSGLEPFHYENEDGKIAPLDSKKAALSAVEQSRVTWQMAGEEQVAYAPRFFSGGVLNPKVELRLTCGIKPPPLSPLFLPNRVEMHMARNLMDGSARVLQNVFRALVALFQPDFGFVGTRLFPQAPEPVISNGTPVVGIYTYLSKKYPTPMVEKPARVEQVGVLGALLTAHEEWGIAADDKHLAAAVELEKKLTEARVLVPAGTG